MKLAEFMRRIGVPEELIPKALEIMSKSIPNTLKWKELYELGLTQSQIGMLFGVKRHTITVALSKLRKGLPRKDLQEYRQKSTSTMLPYYEKLKKLLEMVPFSGKKTKIRGILEFYRKDPDRFDNYSELYRLLRAFGVGASTARFICDEFVRDV